MGFKIIYKASIQHDLKKLDPFIAKKVLDKLEKDLSDNFRKGEALTGEYKGLFKYRIGDYRVLYALLEEEILVLRIAHRKESYRGKISF